MWKHSLIFSNIMKLLLTIKVSERAIINSTPREQLMSVNAKLIESLSFIVPQAFFDSR